MMPDEISTEMIITRCQMLMAYDTFKKQLPTFNGLMTMPYQAYLQEYGQPDASLPFNLPIHTSVPPPYPGSID
jgi:hypothetical protein